MELKLNKEEILMSEPILSTKQEQAVELDYVLPDYYPEIFKIIKCITTPRIVSCSVNGDKLNYDISVSVRVLYCAEESGAIQVIEQKMMYSKTADMSRTGIDPDINIVPRTDYINCRAVNQRRIDIRGAVSADINVFDTAKSEIISDAFGMDIQLKKLPVTYPVNRLYTSKIISLNDEFELGMSKPAIDSIVWYDAVVASTDKKVIANKMVAKGELYINMLYTYSSGGETGMESMQFTMPFSQIIELEGIDERFECFVDADVMSCEIQPHADGEGNSKLAECDLSLMIKCTAYRTSTVEFAVDEYSSSYESSDTKADVKIETMPQYINYSGIIKASVNNGGDDINCIYSVKCQIKDYTTSADTENKCVIISGNAVYTVIYCDGEKKSSAIEKEEPFELNIPISEISENCIIKLKAAPISCSYNLVSENTVEIKTDIKVCGTVCCVININGLSDIFVDENSSVMHDNNCAVKLYFADCGETVWDIAKRYRSSVDAIIDENDIDSETISDNCMLIIPII